MIMQLFTFLTKKEPGKPYNTDLSKDAIPGDMLLHRGPRSNILYCGIQMFTSSPYNHAEIYMGNGWAAGAEAFGTEYSDLCEKEGVDLFRPVKEPSQETRNKIVEACKGRIGHAYSYEQGFLFPFLSKERIKKLTKDTMHNCSEMAALCYKDAGINVVDIDIGLEAQVAPADIGRSKKLKYIGTYVNGKLYSRDEQLWRNQVCREIQGNDESFLAKIIINLFKKWSKKDDFYAMMFEKNIYLDKQAK